MIAETIRQRLQQLFPESHKKPKVTRSSPPLQTQSRETELDVRLFLCAGWALTLWKWGHEEELQPNWSGMDRKEFDWSSIKINQLTLHDMSTAVTQRHTHKWTWTVTCCANCSEYFCYFLNMFLFCLHCLYLLYEVKLWDTVYWTLHWITHTHKQWHSVVFYCMESVRPSE